MTDLEKYGAQHEFNCPAGEESIGSRWRDGEAVPCECGLAEAIEREKNEQPIAHTGGSATPHLVTWLGRKWVPLDDLKEARAQLAQAREARGRRLMAATVDAGPDVGEDPDHLGGHEWHQDAEGNPYCSSVDCDQTCAALEGRKP